jgi:hypothetical protein
MPCKAACPLADEREFFCLEGDQHEVARRDTERLRCEDGGGQRVGSIAFRRQACPKLKEIGSVGTQARELDRRGRKGAKPGGPQPLQRGNVSAELAV